MVRFGFTSVASETLREKPAIESLTNKNDYDLDALFFLISWGDIVDIVKVYRGSIFKSLMGLEI